jgi:NADH-quinone oxidoreductase subunit C
MNLDARRAEIEKLFPGKVRDSRSDFGDDTLIVEREIILPLMRFLKHESAEPFNMLMDLGGLDMSAYPDHEGERFQIVYHLYDIGRGERLRVKVPVPEDDPIVDSIHDVWKCVNWFEREAWDMFGVRFRGHPNLKRILNHVEFKGHPLRKDYPIKKRQALSAVQDMRDEIGLAPSGPGTVGRPKQSDYTEPRVGESWQKPTS